MKLSKDKQAEAKAMNARYVVFKVVGDAGKEDYFKTFGRAYKNANNRAYTGENVSLYGLNVDVCDELYGC